MGKLLRKNIEIWILSAFLILGLILIFILVFFPIQKKPASFPSISTPTPKVTQVLPSEDFNGIVNQLNTPQKLIDYLNEKFTFEDRESDFSLTPEEFFKAKKGKRNDIATFCSFVLFQNGYYSTIFRYKFIDSEGKERVKTLTLFVENDQGKYIDLENSKLKIVPAGTSPFDFLRMEEEKYNVKIKEYAAFTFGTSDFTKGDWLPR